MITEDYCSYEVSKLLKDKGFNDPFTHMFINKDNVKFDCSSSGVVPKETIACPTHQMAMKWLRKVHNQHVQIKYFHGAYQEFEYVVINTFNGKAYHEPVSFSSYEEAVEAALKYTLENLI